MINTHTELLRTVASARSLAQQFEYEMRAGTGVAHCFVRDRTLAATVAVSVLSHLDEIEREIKTIAVGDVDPVLGLYVPDEEDSA
jgi:hypothetical protein